jgi:hypothetical protein
MPLMLLLCEDGDTGCNSTTFGASLEKFTTDVFRCALLNKFMATLGFAYVTLEICGEEKHNENGFCNSPLCNAMSTHNVTLDGVRNVSNLFCTKFSWLLGKARYSLS